MTDEELKEYEAHAKNTPYDDVRDHLTELIEEVRHLRACESQLGKTAKAGSDARIENARLKKLVQLTVIVLVGGNDFPGGMKEELLEKIKKEYPDIEEETLSALKRGNREFWKALEKP